MTIRYLEIAKRRQAKPQPVQSDDRTDYAVISERALDDHPEPFEVLYAPSVWKRIVSMKEDFGL